MRPPSSLLKPVLAACLSLCSWSLQAQAQNPAVELKFITFPPIQEPLEMELIISKDETLKLEIASNELSEGYRVPRLSTMVFGESSVDAEGKPKFDIFGKGSMANGKKQIVLILRKGATFSQGFEVRALSSDADAFGGGKFLFLNATARAIGGKAGNKPFALNPGNHVVIKPNLEPDGRRAYVEFFYSENDENGTAKAIPFYNSFWPVAKHSRGLVFFLQDPITKKITHFSYRDFLED